MNTETLPLRRTGFYFAVAAFCYWAIVGRVVSDAAQAPVPPLSWQGHAGQVCFVGFSPDGKRIVSGS